MLPEWLLYRRHVAFSKCCQKALSAHSIKKKVNRREREREGREYKKKVKGD